MIAMTCSNRLAYPHLQLRAVNGISLLTDDALASSVSVYAGFTLRLGGVSKPPYDSLNLATHVNDETCDVARNRQLLLDALGFSHAPLLVPNQVHGTTIISVESVQDSAWRAYEDRAAKGADGLIVGTSDAAALLCFADCLPAIIVSPSGRFAVLHAGWRGALAGIVGKAIRQMEQQDVPFGTHVDASSYNMYIGPHIEAACFEVSAEIARRFDQAYGPEVLLDERHVSLANAVRIDAMRAGIDERRIAQTDACTVCNKDTLFSYRESGGVCGRQGAFGIRRQRYERR